MSQSGIPEAAQWWHEFDFGAGISLSLDARLLHEERTEYQLLQVFEHARLGRVLALDGIIQTTQADEFIYHEMMAHVPLLGGSRVPRRVLIVGGGDGGMLREVLLHASIERVVMVEIDRAVVEACAKHVEIHGDYDDPRVELIFGDASAYVASDPARAQPFDVVIVDSTDPVGPGEVLFTDAFLADVAACLVRDGVMVRQAGVPFLQREEMPAAVTQARRAFAAVQVYRAAVPTYHGGDMAFVVGHRSESGSLASPRSERTGRYYNPRIHSAAFALPSDWDRALSAL